MMDIRRRIACRFCIWVSGIIVVLVLCNTQVTQGQTVAVESGLIQNDSLVKIGKLENGLTYILRNVPTANSVEMRLVVKAGHSHVRKGELELPHLMEHIPMSGTPSFPNTYKIFQTYGLTRGRDINASTSDDATTFRMTIPYDNKELFTKVLRFLRDCAGNVEFDSVRVAHEKSALINEFQRGNDYEGYMETQYRKNLMGNSRFAYQYEIDLPAEVSKFQPPTLANFYKAWYRPDNEAIIVVGKIDERLVIAQIKEVFSDLVKPDQPLRKIDGNVIADSSLLEHHFTILTHPQQAETVFKIGKKFPHHSPVRRVQDLEKQLLSKIFNEVTRIRAERLIKSNLIHVSNFYLSFSNPFNVIGPDFDFLFLTFSTIGDEKEAVFEITREIERIRCYGFNMDEFKTASGRVMQKNAKSLSNEISTISSNLVGHFIYGHRYPDPATLNSSSIKYIETLTLQKFNDTIKSWFSGESLDVVIVAPELKQQTLPDSSTLFSWIRSAKKQKVSRLEPEPILTPKFSKVRKRKSSEKISARYLGSHISEYQFQNGLKLFLKTMRDTLSPGRTQLSAVNPLGLKEISSKYHATASCLPAILNQGPLGTLSGDLVKEFYANHNLYMGYSLTNDYSQIDGNVLGGNTEFLFQAMYQTITSKRPEIEGYNLVISRLLKQASSVRNNDQDTINATAAALFNENRTQGTFNDRSDIDQISFSRIKQIFEYTFGTPKDFAFVLVSDLDSSLLLNLAAQYIGGLSTNKAHRDLPTEIRASSWDKAFLTQPLPSTSETRIINTGSIPGKAETRIYLRGKHTHNDETNFKLSILTDIIAERLNSRLRDEEGGVYNVLVSSSPPSHANDYYWLVINYVSSETDFDRLLKATIHEVSNFESKVDDETVNRIIKSRTRKLQNWLSSFDFWVGYLKKSATDNASIALPGFEVPVITVQQIRDSSKTMFDRNAVTVIGLLPRPSVSNE